MKEVIIIAFRILLIENEADIRLKLKNIVISKLGEEDIWIPIDDISIIVIDNLAIRITIRMLTQLAESGVGVVVCDQEHLPIGFYGGYDTHSRASKVLGHQIRNDHLYDHLWAKIVQGKIMNQLKALKILGKGDINIYEKMKEFAREVQPGDITNRESYAAKIYFNVMMGMSFSRGNPNILLNSGLDYGYAIIRSYLARICVAYGLNTQIGIHHRNEYNRFNLVDDLMEPFRPIVDIHANKILENEEFFKSTHRRSLVNILNHTIRYMDKEMYICNAMEEFIQQVAANIMENPKELVMPDVSEYRWREEYEI